MNAALVICGIIIVWYTSRMIRNGKRQDDESNFDLATVNEKFQMAKQTNDSLHSMEQLVTDLDLCSEENQKVIQISWLGDDGENYAYDLYCDGVNTATECMREIAERETHDLRNELAYQCNVLARATRHRKNSRKNYEKTVELEDLPNEKAV